MRKLGVWGLAASLALGLAAQTGRADGAEEAKAAEESKAREEGEARLRQQVYRAREDYFRRQAVCDRLKEVAIQQCDARLERRAEELGNRAWELFLRKKAQFKGLAGPSPDVPEGDEAAEAPRKEGKP